MTARHDSADEHAGGSSGGRALLAGAGILAVAATAFLVLSDELRWLRLGIVAALWAALVGAFIAARYRRQVADQEEDAAERQELYELELEREIAARREHELEVAAEAKRKAEEESRDDIAELRDELLKMRQTLESLLGGEFLVERYALRAESTRMRSLPEDRSLAGRSDIKRLSAANGKQPDIVAPPVVREAETELIERIREVHHKPRREPAREVHRPEQPRTPRRPERPARTDRSTPEPVTQAKRQDPQTRIVEHPAELSDRWFIPEGIGDTPPPQRRKDAAPQRNEPDRARRPESAPRQPEPARAPAPRQPEPARAAASRQPEPARAAASRQPEPARADASRRPESAPRQPEPARADVPRRPETPPQQQRRTEPDRPRRAEPEPVPPRRGDTPPRRSVDTPPKRPSEPAPRRASPTWEEIAPEPPPQRESGGGGKRVRAPELDPAVAHAPAGMPFGTTAEQTSWLAQYNLAQEAQQLAQQQPGYASRGYVQPAMKDSPPKPPPPPNRRGPGYADPGSGYVDPGSGYVDPRSGYTDPRSGYTDPRSGYTDPRSGYVDPGSGYVDPASVHRHRAVAPPPSMPPPPPPEGPDTGGGRRRRAEGQPSWQESMARADQQPSGSHAAGRSVNELLANHGAESSPRRRRRRED